MKQLVEGAGVHRQTIHFYLREGVLPPPSDRGRGHARYGEQHLALLKLVREMRDERGMSLDAIRRHFAGAGFDAIEARRALAGGAAPSPLTKVEAEPIAADELVERTGAPEALLHTLVKAGAVSPDLDVGGDRYGLDALAILGAAWRLEEQGVSRDALLRLLHHAEGVAGVEVSVLAADASGLSGDGEPLARRAERRHGDIGQLLSAVRRGALRAVLHRLVEVGPRARRFAEDAIYIPSPLFIRRHRLDRALAAAQAAAEGGEAHATRRLGRLLLGLGRYAEAVLWFSRSAHKEPDDAETHAYLGLARATAGAIAAGVESCRRAVALAPTSPRTHAFLGATLAIHAALTTGLESPGEQLRHALHVANHSRTFTARDAREHMEVLLARGRMFTVLPDGMPGRPEGIADLEEVVRLTAEEGGDQGLDFPGTGALHRVHALYYLGVTAHEEGRHDQARAWLSECITIDPVSRFAELAYELLGTAPR